MWARRLLMTAVLVGCAAVQVSAQTLSVGDPAPAIQVKEFVKGTPVSSFEKGKTYVVEFWATWCGPCKVSIPHLTEMQNKYKDITFIGVSVWEQSQDGVKPFVQAMGDQMAYRVAMDQVPPNGNGNEGAMAKSWMQAAGQNGIPTAFVVNGDSKIVWIGHPMTMDKPLEEIVTGKWDVAKAVAESKREQAEQGKLQELQAKLAAAQRSGDPKQVVAVLDRAIADDPSRESMLGPAKFQFLLGKGGDPAKAAVYGKRLVETVLKDSPEQLNGLAWLIVDPAAPSKATPVMVKLALQAALRADTIAQGKDAAIADTLAKAYFDSGNAAKAAEAQERAVRLVKGTPQENDKELMDRLAQYRKAAAGKK
jgi:thiol-disulfide isomerase/thioredoxin